MISPEKSNLTISLITTVYNEEASIGMLLDAILAQSRQPDEIVITDAGSKERTVAIIERYISNGMPIRLIVRPGANRSRGRNLAIAASKGQIIVSTDAGCVPTREWLAQLVEPFESETPPDVVAGYYQPEAYDTMERAIAAATVPDISEVDPSTFLPSSRSVAFTREAWERVGGYPEYSGYAEDTAFNFRLRAAGCRFFFQPAAIVHWQMQPWLHAVFNQFYRYARSDGELGHWFGHYFKAYLMFAIVLLWFMLSYWRPALGWLIFPLALIYWLRYLWRARKRGAEWLPALAAPLINLTVDLAHVVGYTDGKFHGRPHPGFLPTDRPLSIVQITYTYQPITGGADVYAAQLADLITASGHHHCVYQRKALTEARDVRFVPNLLHNHPLEFWTQALALFRLRREILSHDVVICHYPHYLLAVAIMSWFGRRPVRIAVSHGVFWDDAPGAFRNRLKAWLTKCAFRCAHLYIANDTNFLRAMGLNIEPGERMFSEVAPRVWFISNGVDTDKFKRTDPRPEIQSLNAIIVPRNLFRNRGIHLAIEAYEIFRKSYTDIKLVIVGGGGQPEYIRDLEEYIDNRGLRPHVIFYGSAPHDKLPAIYSSAQLTLIPSLCGEGTSLSALESMACGTATIGTFVAGLRDLPGPHALPIASSLAEIMLEVYPERVQIGEEQRRQVLDSYSIGKWRKTWRSALESMGVSFTKKKL